ncbi:unnamed protein product [Protopolystoma xenopodis]|uniref:Uncharacterized protein n=1 Tax=Protopolystoma xenopodis TaxID=117903 RepID=A0A448WF79_9PLAT|nr:unnamed protein product [Protopolystoma xenopodis]
MGLFSLCLNSSLTLVLCQAHLLYCFTALLANKHLYSTKHSNWNALRPLQDSRWKHSQIFSCTSEASPFPDTLDALIDRPRSRSLAVGRGSAGPNFLFLQPPHLTQPLQTAGSPNTTNLTTSGFASESGLGALNSGSSDEAITLEQIQGLEQTQKRLAPEHSGPTEVAASGEHVCLSLFA